MRAAVRGYRAAMATGAPRGGVPTGRAAPGLAAPGILRGVRLGGGVGGTQLQPVLPVEGVVNHHVLDIHNVRDDVDTAWPWNVGFLALSAVLVLTGRRLTRVRGARHSG